MRTDISNYLFHGVRRINNTNYPSTDEIPTFPLLEDDDNPDEFDVLKNIIREGAIRASLSYRNGYPTVYGNRPVVCFTEMPLLNIIEYENQHKKKPKISTYGIAVLKKDLFKFGGRPVISGLSGAKPNILNNKRVLDESILPLIEQYRYVYLNLSSSIRKIDWTHEREWRIIADNELTVKNPLNNSYYNIKGLNVFDVDNFDECIITVKTSQEAEEISEIIEHQLDMYHSYGIHDFSTKIKYLVLEQAIIAMNKDIKCTKIENLPKSAFYTYNFETLTNAEQDRIRTVIEDCKNLAEVYAEQFIKDNQHRLDGNSGFKDISGFAFVKSYYSRNKYIRFLIKNEYMYATQDGSYTFENLHSKIPYLQGLCYVEYITKNQKEYLNEKIDNLFTVETLID